MILNCRNCGSSLQYDFAEDKLRCAYCSTRFDLSEFDREDEKEAEIETKMCVCNACGARLMLNNAQGATFCVFCGQPTVVQERLSKVKRPDYIVPFSISEEQAKDIIRAKLRKGTYIPEGMKNSKLEMLKGVYVPFMQYNMDYRDRQLIELNYVEHADRTHDGETIFRYFYREAECNFPEVLVDASAALIDESARRLRPYDLDRKRPFHIGYLSGCYASGMDEDSRKVEEIAKVRCGRRVDDELLRSVPGSFSYRMRELTNRTEVDMKVIKSDPTVDILSAEYLLLPVWCAVFCENGKAYSVMVNGQTGKIVGALPGDEKKIKRRTEIYSVIMGSILGLGMAVGFFYLDALYPALVISGLSAVVSVFLYLRQQRKFIEYRLSGCLSGTLGSRNMTEYR